MLSGASQHPQASHLLAHGTLCSGCNTASWEERKRRGGRGRQAWRKEAVETERKLNTCKLLRKEFKKRVVILLFSLVPRINHVWMFCDIPNVSTGLNLKPANFKYYLTHFDSFECRTEVSHDSLKSEKRTPVCHFTCNGQTLMKVCFKKMPGVM